MSEPIQYDEDELKWIHAAKRSLKILAKVAKDLDSKEVIKDEDIAVLIQERGWENDPAKLPRALADEEIGKMIRERLTPDLTQLNPEQEAMMIGQLGAVIFTEILKLESNE